MNIAVAALLVFYILILLRMVTELNKEKSELYMDLLKERSRNEYLDHKNKLLEKR